MDMTTFRRTLSMNELVDFDDAIDSKISYIRDRDQMEYLHNSLKDIRVFSKMDHLFSLEKITYIDRTNCPISKLLSFENRWNNMGITSPIHLFSKKRCITYDKGATTRIQLVRGMHDKYKPAIIDW